MLNKDNGSLLSGLDKEAVKQLFSRPLNNVNVNLDNLKQRVLRVKASSKNSKLYLYQAKIKKLIVEKNCNLTIDLRDNHFVDTVIVKDNFSGTINLSRNTISTIEFADNCRCNLTIHGSLKCFKLSFGDVFSGSLDIEDSCFHLLKVGYYCYADIKLQDNWGSKTVRIGNSFRGSLTMNNVLVPDIEIGDDCKGDIAVSSRDEDMGAKHLNLADEFNGRIDLSGCQTVEAVDVGSHAGGKLDFAGCPSIRVLKFDECFKGEAQLSDSAIEYIHAKDGCEGSFILFNCRNLTLMRLPRSEMHRMDTDLTPLKIERGGRHIYYHFQERSLPAHYFKTGYRGMLKGLKKYIKKHLSSPNL